MEQDKRYIVNQRNDAYYIVDTQHKTALNCVDGELLICVGNEDVGCLWNIDLANKYVDVLNKGDHEKAV